MSNFIQELKDKAQGLTLTREQYIIKATFELHQIALNYDDEKLIESLAKLCSYALILDFDIDESEFELGDRQGIVELVLLSLYESLAGETFSKENGLFRVCFNALKFLGADSFKEIEMALSENKGSEQVNYPQSTTKVNHNAIHSNTKSFGGFWGFVKKAPILAPELETVRILRTISKQLEDVSRKLDK
ncbi:hypothetical protein CUPS4244_02600 [Campylobacter upsaliensis]|uniref:hypothetical protein n=1 Tax=Campylobacter upsaliensis TaxID=28080 RepID=UPI002149B6AF|nr:hypothetical protein [Campylobacter upsaliensis]MCR2103987.1 hypothetical protein [Campylobacter upsaliensis]